MTRRVIFDEDAVRDLEDLFLWLSEEASVAVAERYLARLQAYCSRFDEFPIRGTARDDLEPGLRLIGFERRVTLAFLVTDEAVVFTRVLYGGRDPDGLLDWGVHEDEAAFADD